MTEAIDELVTELEERNNLEGTDSDDDVVPSHYEITSYGIDFDVEGLVRRIERGDIYIPEFQREFVWKMTESSRFIESLLLGLPVPGIFLAQESDTGKMLVIDGQQRLLTLKYFYEGYFHANHRDSSRRIFRLMKVQPEFDTKTYEDLDGKDRMNLDNSVIHATVVKQDSPSDGDSSIYHIFERLNSGGRKLAEQEIRCAVYHGKLIDMLSRLNDHPSWREIFGKKNSRMRDQELILRFFALFDNHKNYKKPMVEFLNNYSNSNKNPSDEHIHQLEELFTSTTDLFTRSISTKIFRVSRALNVAFFDSAMVGLATRVTAGPEPSEESVRQGYSLLLNDEDFIESLSQSTADISAVSNRIEKAISAFSNS